MSNAHYTAREKESLKLWIELIRYSGKLQQIIDDKLRQNHGQNISRFDVLSQLVRKIDHGLTVGDLAQRLIASKGNITGLLDRMQKDGLLKKTPRVEDKRSYVIKISNKGIKIFEEMAENHANWVAAAFKAIDIDNMKEFTQFLNKVRTSLDDI